MEQATRKLQAMMQMHYGEEYRRKWQGFSPREMAEIWSRRFALDKIHPSVVVALGDRLNWEHPPTLPQVLDALDSLQRDMADDLERRRAAVALPSPSEVADPNSPIVKQALAEMREFINARRMPS